MVRGDRRAPRAAACHPGVSPAELTLLSGRPPEARGKFLVVNGHKFYPRGVTYWHISGRQRGPPVSRARRVENDFELMAKHGINTLRTYSVPPPWLLHAAERHRLLVLVGLRI